MRRAFTLIELLVVIAIIAILAAILFPVFAQAKMAAKGAAAISNMKQMQTATVLYVGDFDDTLPLAAYGTMTGFLIWTDLLDPYLKNKEVWLCPGSSVKVTDLTGARTSHWGYNARYLTDLALDFSNANDSKSTNMSAIAAPADTVLFTSAKSSVVDSWCGDDGKFLLPPTGVPTDCWGVPDYVHMESAVVGWTDGHAKRLKASSFYKNQAPADRFFDLLED